MSVPALLDRLTHDIRFALRAIARSPGYAAVSILTIAIGIAATTTMFSAVQAVLIRKLPYRNADRVFTVGSSYDLAGVKAGAVSGPEYFEMRDNVRALDGLAMIRPRSWALTGVEGDPEQLSGAAVTPNLFSLLGAAPVIGRDLQTSDGDLNAPKVALISNGLWRRRFGGDASIVGRTISVAGVPTTVVGVMGPGVRFPDEPVSWLKNPVDIWLPTSVESQRDEQYRGNQIYAMIGRKRAGATDAEVARDMRSIEQRFKREFPDRYASKDAANWHLVATTLRDDMVGSVRTGLLVISAAVVLLLMIACVNVAGLLLARLASRRRELGVRLALGASPSRVIAQLLTETTVLSMLGGAVGVALTALAVRAVVTLGQGMVPGLEHASVNGTLLAFALGVSMTTGVVVGLVPALRELRRDPSRSLGDSTRGSSEGRRSKSLRSGLLVAQVAMALVILNAAALLGRTFVALQKVNPGLDPAGVMTMYLSAPRAKYDSAAKIARLYESMQQQMTSIPGVTAASGIEPLPMGGDGWSGSFDIEGRDAKMEAPHAEFAAILPGYFKTMGISLLEGRDFSSADRRGAEPVAIVDQALARKYWPNESAIGKRINANEDAGQWETIIGVVRHVRSGGPRQEVAPQLYIAYLQHPQGTISMVTRRSVVSDTASVADVATLTPSLRAAVRAIDADLPVAKLRPMPDLVREATARERFNLVLLGCFALVALVLATIGLYAAMSQLVAQRAREMGIRLALGGQPASVRWMVVRESVSVAVVGVGIGLVVSGAVSGVMRGLVFGVSALDPVSLLGVGALLMIVAWGAAVGPARRATGVDVVGVMRG